MRRLAPLAALVGLLVASTADAQSFRGYPRPNRSGISTALTAGYDAATQAYFNAMTVQPDAARKALLATEVQCEEAWGAASKLDWFVITAAHDAQAGRVNMFHTGKVLSVLPTSLTFTTDRGYTGDGGTDYLGYNEGLAAGGQYAVNSATLGYWWNTYGGGVFIGTVNSSNNSGSLSTPTSFAFKVNGATAVTGTMLSTDHDLSGVRTDSSTLSIYSGTPGSTLSQKATSASNAADGTVTSNTGSLLKLSGAGTALGRIAAAWSGTALSLSDLQAHHACLSTYLTAIGAQ